MPKYTQEVVINPRQLGKTFSLKYAQDWPLINFMGWDNYRKLNDQQLKDFRILTYKGCY